MGYDAIVALLATIRLWRLWYSGGQSRLVEVICRDQVIWYILVAAVSIVNLVVAYATPLPQGAKQRGVVASVLTALTSISVRSRIFSTHIWLTSMSASTSRRRHAGSF